MQPSGTIERVVLFPRSGYSNRLQAMASADALAQQLGAQSYVCWETESVIPDSADSVFDAGFCAASVVSAEFVSRSWEIEREALPRYLNSLPDQGLIVLAGHDHGEQAYIPELRDLIAAASDGTTLVIVAGGQFFDPELTLPGAEDFEVASRFRSMRHDYYARLRFVPAIEDGARKLIDQHSPYLALHLRYTDRSHQAPFERSIRRALIELSRQTGLRSVFIAGDSAAIREKWVAEVSKLGLEPWTAAHASWDRSAAGSGTAALIDWRILSRSAGMVYFAESTFAEEAAVAGDHYEISRALPAHPVRSVLVRAKHVARDVITYPKRVGRD